jgi:imidazole glycerol phosphate synthase subunit HisF
MRVGASLLLKNGFCYQSYRWQYLRPLGSLQNAVRMLEERQVDDISIIRYCREDQNQANFQSDLELISNLDCTTPLAFGGGIRDRKSLNMVHQLPVERILLSSAYIEKNIGLIEEAMSIFGKQALIAVLPYRVCNNRIEYFHCRMQRFVDCDLEFIDLYSNEVMLYNTDQEGLAFSNDSDTINLLHFDPSKIILSGGINHEFIKKTRKTNIAAICIDNSALHKEFNFSQL